MSINYTTATDASGQPYAVPSDQSTLQQFTTLQMRLNGLSDQILGGHDQIAEDGQPGAATAFLAVPIETTLIAYGVNVSAAGRSLAAQGASGTVDDVKALQVLLLNFDAIMSDLVAGYDAQGVAPPSASAPETIPQATTSSTPSAVGSSGSGGLLAVGAIAVAVWLLA